MDARKIRDFGIGTYIRGIVGAAARLRPDWELLLLGPDRLPAELQATANLRTVRDRASRYGVAELLRPPSWLSGLGADVFHAPHYTMPLRPGVPSVVTIHDCIHLRFPQALPRPLGFLPRALSRAYARLMIRHATRVAESVIVVSEATGRDLSERVGADPDRIHVIHNGCDDLFHAEPDSQEITAARQRSGISGRFLLWVGNPKPHKNLDRLLEAWDRIAPARPEVELVLVGSPEAGGGSDARVRTLGHIPAVTLRALYHAAEGLVIPSLYEGFGLPAAEAMACGTAVVAADVGGLPEVVGEAGLLVRPERVEEIGAAMARLLDDADLRARLGAAGRERADRFRWNRAAAATVRVWERATGGS